MRRFWLERIEDETGISGTGRIAEGVEYGNGWCSMMWTTQHWSLCVYPSLRAVIEIHGHNGKTVLRWIDPAPGADSGRK